MIKLNDVFGVINFESFDYIRFIWEGTMETKYEFGGYASDIDNLYSWALSEEFLSREVLDIKLERDKLVITLGYECE